MSMQLFFLIKEDARISESEMTIADLQYVDLEHLSCSLNAYGFLLDNIGRMRKQFFPANFNSDRDIFLVSANMWEELTQYIALYVRDGWLDDDEIQADIDKLKQLVERGELYLSAG